MQIANKKIFVKSSFDLIKVPLFLFSSSISSIQRQHPQRTRYLYNHSQKFQFCSMDTTNQQEQTKSYPPPKRIAERDAFVGKWLKMKYIDYEIRGKVMQNYEMIERTTRRKDTGFDGVNTFAILKKDNEPSKLIIIANYRIPVDKYVLEIPAGLMDCPDLIQNAIRELKEETGYIAEQIPLKLSNIEVPATYTDPWRSCSCSKSVFLEVNGNKPENINPKQELEESESIFVHLIDIDENICDNITTLADKHNYIISSNLYCFAQGIQFAKRFKI